MPTSRPILHYVAGLSQSQGPGDLHIDARGSARNSRIVVADTARIPREELQPPTTEVKRWAAGGNRIALCSELVNTGRAQNNAHVAARVGHDLYHSKPGVHTDVSVGERTPLHGRSSCEKPRDHTQCHFDSDRESGYDAVVWVPESSGRADGGCVKVLMEPPETIHIENGHRQTNVNANSRMSRWCGGRGLFAADFCVWFVYVS